MSCHESQGLHLTGHHLSSRVYSPLRKGNWKGFPRSIFLRCSSEHSTRWTIIIEKISRLLLLNRGKSFGKLVPMAEHATRITTTHAVHLAISAKGSLTIGVVNQKQTSFSPTRHERSLFVKPFHDKGRPAVVLSAKGMSPRSHAKFAGACRLGGLGNLLAWSTPKR